MSLKKMLEKKEKKRVLKRDLARQMFPSGNCSIRRRVVRIVPRANSRPSVANVFCPTEEDARSHI